MTPPAETLHLLLKAWAAKEAVSKALGDGLSFPYEKIDTYDLLVSGEQHASISVKELRCAIAYHVLSSTDTEQTILALAVLGVSADQHVQRSLADMRIERISVDTIVDQVLTAAVKDKSEHL